MSSLARAFAPKKELDLDMKVYHKALRSTALLATALVRGPSCAWGNFLLPKRLIHRQVGLVEPEKKKK